MFKSKYWSGVYVATMGWWGLLALVRFVKMSDMRLNPTVGMMLAPSLVVLMILASGFVGYQTEAIRRKKNLLWGLHAIVGGVGAAGLVPLTSEVVRDSNTIFAILRQSLLFPILYAVVAWPFYRLGKKSKIWIRELKQKGSRLRLKDAAKIMVSDFGMAIFNEISTDRRWVYAISYMLTGFGLFLLYPPMTFSPTIKITVWFLTAGSLVVISLVIYAEVLEKSGAKEELRIAHDMQMGLMPNEDLVVRGF
ncbi:MAG: hypothetical protein HYY49_11155 [Ignavibacteriales bacterium]|nr:hypothetical protein [Ignavibacteriales bacterium]